MTKINCDISSCKYNNSCCCCTNSTETYCTKDAISLGVGEESICFECNDYKVDEEKEVECAKCQISKYGSIILEKNVEFEIVKSKDVPF